MSFKYQTTNRCYLIDHHSPDLPCITFDRIDFDEYERFFTTANVDSIMLYCKDHWGNCYYPSKVPGAYMHPALNGVDYVGEIKKRTDQRDIEFVAYYSFEYDTGAAMRNPDWRVLHSNGSEVIRDDLYAKWKLCCMQTGYAQYCIAQMEEILKRYAPDAFFIDIFGASLCYCPTCKAKYKHQYGCELPESREDIVAYSADMQAFLEQNSFELLQIVRTKLKAIDPTIAITINFASHYPARIRALLDYQFAEPVLQDNWFSSAYTRATAKGRYPIMMPGEFSAVYNYPATQRYIADLSEIAAQGCRVGMYSGAQHTDGSLEMTEAQKVGEAFAEIQTMSAHLRGAEFVKYVAIVQSDASLKINAHEFKPDSILRLKQQEPHVRAVLGAMKLCESAKIPYCVLPEQEAQSLREYALVLLPELFIVSPALRAALEQYTKEGGVVLSSMGSGLYGENLQPLDDCALSQLFGIHYRGKEDRYAQNTWSAYLKSEQIGGLFQSTTPPVSEAFAHIAVTNAATVAAFLPPCVQCDSDHWINWWSPPPDKTVGGSAVTKNCFGNGIAFYCAFDLFTMAAQEAYECAHDLFAYVLAACPPPPIRHCTPSGALIRTAFRKREREWIVHQISQVPKRFHGQSTVILAGDIVLREDGFTVLQAQTVYPTRRKLTIEKEKGLCTIHAGQLEIQQIISIHVEK